MAATLNPAIVANKYLEEVQDQIARLDARPNVVAFLTTDAADAATYAKFTRQACERVGIDYELRRVPRLGLEEAIQHANEDDTVHGIFIYWPVFDNEQDAYLRNQVDYRKDIEGLSLYWTRKLYANDRTALADGSEKKAILPCTPLAIIKLLTEGGFYGTGEGEPLRGKTVCIFNRSEVIGRPLAVMMSNDGARVYSFDIHGPLLFESARPAETAITRQQAISEADIVITGVPSEDFEKVHQHEIKAGAVCVNFSSIPNFADEIDASAGLFIPRVGPVTVAMCMRNSLRLYLNFFAGTEVD